MTGSRHEYAAHLIGSTDLPLSPRGGSITLDAGQAPHVQGTIVIPMPAADILAALDPRESPRVRVDVVATFPGSTQERTFDLGLRDRDVQHADGLVRLTVASDEALLEDFAPLVDDLAPFDLAASLRDVVAYVLDTAIPGAVLEPGDLDADITPYWTLTNLHPNPRTVGTTYGFGAGGGANAPTLNAGPPANVRWTTNAAISNLIVAPSLTAFRVTPGKSYVFEIDWASASVGRSAQPIIQWRNVGSAAVIGNSYGEARSYSPDYQRLSVIATAPPGAEYAYPIISTGVNAATTTHVAKNPMFYEGRHRVPAFSGATPDTAQYRYDWGDATAPDASSSVRTPLVESPDPDALVWKAGQTALEFLAPLVQASGLRLVCDELRRWTLRDEDYRAAGSLSIRHGINAISADDTISRAGRIWYDAAIFRYRWRDSDGVNHERIDGYALNDPYVQLATFDIAAAYPGPGRAEYAVRRAQGRGRELTVTSVADWRANAEQPMTVHLESTPIQTGTAQSVRFDLDRDEMTVTTRSTDTPPLAWVLGPDDLTWSDAAPVTWNDLTDWSDL